jgi:hypothetical protein
MKAFYFEITLAQQFYERACCCMAAYKHTAKSLKVNKNTYRARTHTHAAELNKRLGLVF